MSIQIKPEVYKISVEFDKVGKNIMITGTHAFIVV